MSEAIDVENRILRIERHFKAPIERVFEAWTNPETLAKWWGPEKMHVPEYEMDVREGGKWITTMVSDETGERYTVHGVYQKIESPHHLAFTWAWIHEDGPGHETTVDIRFQSTDDGTLMIFEQKVFAEEEHRDNHNGGWTSSFICLDQLLAA